MRTGDNYSGARYLHASRVLSLQVGSELIGRRHRSDCLCGCHLVAGHIGNVIEMSAADNVVIARFCLPRQGGHRMVAYSLPEAKGMRR